MRWEALFSDLQAQWDAARREEDDARIADLAELEMARVSMVDRLRARRGQPVGLLLSDGSALTGDVLDAAVPWLLVAVGERRSIVPVDAVVAAWPLGPVAAEAPAVERRLGLGHVLRAVAREGAAVRVRTVAGVYRGRIVRVGADHLDLATEADAPGRGQVERVTIALRALVALESP